MAPIKFEENIREKLEERTLQPSDELWSKLSDRLEKDSHSYNKSYRFAAVAASIVLLVTVGWLMQSGRNQVVPATPKVVTLEKDEVIIDSKEEVQGITTKPVLKKGSNEVVETTTIAEKVFTRPIQNNHNPAVAEVNPTPKIESSVTNPTLSAESLTMEDLNVYETVAEIRNLSVAQQGVVSDFQVDSLLKAAQKEIVTDKINSSSIRAVNASDLLEEVEDDIEQSFRSKVYDALKSGYKTMKSAVAERNN